MGQDTEHSNIPSGDRLRTAFVDFARAAYPALAAGLKGAGPNEASDRLDVPALTHLMRGVWSTLPEAEVAREAMTEPPPLRLGELLDEEGRPIEPTPTQLRGLRDEQLERFLYTLIAGSGDRQLTDELVSAHCTAFFGLWRVPKVAHRVIVPLMHLALDGPELELDDQLVLRNVDPGQDTALVHRGPLDFHLDVAPEQLSTCRCGLVGSYSTSAANRGGDSSLGGRVETAVAALRLVKDGPIFPVAIYDSTVPLGMGGSRSKMLPYNWRPLPRTGWTVTISPADAVALRETYRELRAVEAAGRGRGLRIALSRFQSAYLRQTDEDRLIDLAIALESTLLHGIDEELRFRLALRGASVLAAAVEPLESFRLLRVMYDVRSKVVHNGASLAECARGGTIEGKPYGEFTGRCTRWTRALLRALLHRLHSGESLEGITRELDTIGLSALRPPGPNEVLPA